MKTHRKASCWVCAQSACGALLFDITTSENEASLQEEAEKKKKDLLYLTNISIYSNR